MDNDERNEHVGYWFKYVDKQISEDAVCINNNKARIGSLEVEVAKLKVWVKVLWAAVVAIGGVIIWLVKYGSS